MTIAELNALAEQAVVEQLLQCCGSRAWASRMAAQRPFADAAALQDAAERTWQELDQQDWLEAFAAHPRIGQRTESAVSQREQAAALSAGETVRAELARLNREYEERHGFIFIVFASGKSPEEMLALLQARMGNDRETEIHNAAAEQMKITHLRLQRLLEQS